MRISEFFGLKLSQAEELAACYLFLEAPEIKAFSLEIIGRAKMLKDKLDNINVVWAREIVAGLLEQTDE